MVADVLVEIKVKQIDQTFTYKVPEELLDQIKIGKRVIVPFGKQTLEGFVIKIEKRSEEFKLKEILKIIDEVPILNDELLELGKYISKKTMTNLITSYQTMLPTALKAKHGFNVSKKYQKYIKLINWNYFPKNDKQKEIMDLLSTNDMLKIELQSISKSALQTLIKNMVVKEYQEEEYRINRIEEMINPDIKLSKEQAEVLKNVSETFDTFKPFLLHGVTGSGKTEVYIRLIEQVLNKGKEAIVLVPEISLTPQLVNIFHQRFGNKIAILHSGLSDGEKYDEWRKIKRKEVSIVIGARSAIFAPLTNIGIIIVDEEHTATYKQENNPKYNAIDIALTRAKYHMCPIILGSATPSIESYTRAKMGIYQLLTMKKRINNILPNVQLIDMKENLKKGYRILSKELQDSLKKCFENKEQAILLLNRRGYATTVTCHECGYKVECTNCDLPLTYHKKSNSMKCHYCSYITFKPNICPDCGSKEINQFGLGTEKLEEEVAKIFPNIKIIRMDIDTTSKKGSHDRIINDFSSKKYDLLIGTQMIAKGLDFEDVTLVGVINGDASLNIPDFRSAEKTFSLLNQVAGRAGRALKEGKVIIQGFNLNHYSIVNASTHNYEGFYKEEMEIRKVLKYPPFYNLSVIKIIGKDYNICIEESDKIYRFLSENLTKEVYILGPSSDTLPKVNNKYYIQITLKYKNTIEIIKAFKFLKEKYQKNNYVSVDFDLSA